jgi:ATP-dependent RNA helicase DeaD
MGTFRSGHADILVATDVASRGIDIRQVDCIINYDVPEDSLLYFHRVGRTARAGDSGKAFTFVSREEFEDFARIFGMTKAPISPLRPQDAEQDFKQMQYTVSSRPERRNYGRRRQNNRFSYGNRRRFR